MPSGRVRAGTPWRGSQLASLPLIARTLPVCPGPRTRAPHAAQAGAKVRRTYSGFDVLLAAVSWRRGCGPLLRGSRDWICFDSAHVRQGFRTSRRVVWRSAVMLNVRGLGHGTIEAEPPPGDSRRLWVFRGVGVSPGFVAVSPEMPDLLR